MSLLVVVKPTNCIYQISNCAFLILHTAIPVDDLIKRLECKEPQLNVFSKSTLPVRLHYARGSRTGDVVGKINARWFLAE